MKFLLTRFAKSGQIYKSQVKTSNLKKSRGSLIEAPAFAQGFRVWSRPRWLIKIKVTAVELTCTCKNVFLSRSPTIYYYCYFGIFKKCPKLRNTEYSSITQLGNILVTFRDRLSSRDEGKSFRLKKLPLGVGGWIVINKPAKSQIIALCK